MRQVTDEAGFVPSVAALELAELIVERRPWLDDGHVASRLRSWSDRHWSEGALDHGLADGAAIVAQHLAVLGRAEPAVSDAAMLGITFGLLRNVAAGRDPTDYDLLRDHVRGVPDRTARRYRQRVRASGGNPGLEALGMYLENLQYDLDLSALVRGGRSVGAARRWLQRHPGLHAKDAPRPRRPR